MKTFDREGIAAPMVGYEVNYLDFPLEDVDINNIFDNMVAASTLIGSDIQHNEFIYDDFMDYLVYKDAYKDVSWKTEHIETVEEMLADGDVPPLYRVKIHIEYEEITGQELLDLWKQIQEKRLKRFRDD